MRTKQSEVGMIINEIHVIHVHVTPAYNLVIDIIHVRAEFADSYTNRLLVRI